MHFLQGGFDSALGKVVQHLVPTHHYISVHDLFNPQLFHSCLIAIISNIPELSHHIETLMMASILKESEGQSTTGYIELRLHNFITIWETILSAFDYLGLPVCRDLGKQALFRMVKQCDLDELQVILEHLFELLIKNHEIVQFITLLPQSDQSRIKDFLQRVKEKTELQQQQQKIKTEDQDEKHKLQQQNIELRNMIASKEVDFQKLTIQILQLQDQIAELKELQLHKQGKIDSLKKRLLAYEQTDTLFQEKDQEITKLHKKMEELLLANRLLSTQLTTQKGKLQQKIVELQQHNITLQSKFDKIYISHQLISRQKQQIQQSNKRVISNLKDKIKGLTDKVGEIQGQLVQSKISRQLRERQYSELWSNYESLKTSSVLTQPPLKKDNNLDRLVLASSGNNKEFLKLGDQLNQIQKMEENAFEQEIMMFESGQDNLKKIQDIINQNAKLKEKLSSYESRGQKEFKDENQRLRKRLAVMKKRNEQLETQRRQELQLMVSAFQSCLRGGKIEQ